MSTSDETKAGLAGGIRMFRAESRQACHRTGTCLNAPRSSSGRFRVSPGIEEHVTKRCDESRSAACVRFPCRIRQSARPTGDSTMDAFRAAANVMGNSDKAADPDRALDSDHRSLRMSSREPSRWSRPCALACINRRKPAFLVLNSPDSMTCAIRASSMSIRIAALARRAFQTVHIAAQFSQGLFPAHHPHSALSGRKGPRTHAMLRRT